MHWCFLFFWENWTKKIAVVFLENLVHELMEFLAKSIYEIAYFVDIILCVKEINYLGYAIKLAKSFSKPKNGNHILVYWSLYSLWDLQNLHVMNISFLLPFCPKRKFPEKQKEFRFLQRKQKFRVFFCWKGIGTIFSKFLILSLFE